MKTYLFIHDIEEDEQEIIIRIEPLYCSKRGANPLDITNLDYTPAKGDKLYFLPGVNIPRIKLKDLSLEYGIKTVRDIDQATHIFAGTKTQDKIMDGNWFYTIDTSILRAIVEDPELMMDDHYKENLKQALEFYNEEIILMEYSAASVFRNSSQPVINRYITNNILSSSSIFYSVDKEYNSLFPDILNIDIYDESKLLKYINGNDAATIDETMFLQISDMFNSSDKDNHILAMEIMANCNYIDSLLYIEMLFNKYSYYMADCHTKNHVNFKSLLSFLGKNKNYMSTDIDQIVKSLINKQVLDIDKINVITKHYGSEIAHRGGTKHFEVKSITLNDETAKLLNTNYVYETVPDYIPEIVEDVANLNSLEETVEDTDTLEIIDEDIVTESNVIDDTEAESELITEELETNDTQEGPKEELNNNPIIETKDDDGFEWF